MHVNLQGGSDDKRCRPAPNFPQTLLQKKEAFFRKFFLKLSSKLSLKKGLGRNAWWAGRGRRQNDTTQQQGACNSAIHRQAVCEGSDHSQGLRRLEDQEDRCSEHAVEYCPQSDPRPSRQALLPTEFVVCLCGACTLTFGIALPKHRRCGRTCT